jgi:hypothetical protein
VSRPEDGLRGAGYLKAQKILSVGVRGEEGGGGGGCVSVCVGILAPFAQCVALRKLRFIKRLEGQRITKPESLRAMLAKVGRGRVVKIVEGK